MRWSRNGNAQGATQNFTKNSTFRQALRLCLFSVECVANRLRSTSRYIDILNNNPKYGNVGILGDILKRAALMNLLTHIIHES